MAEITLAEFLFGRLIQLGISAIHGLPGDYNLKLLDYVKPCGLDWVGNANELNAGYAADGYARIKGIGAIVTTYGVGELSAINAIAGAYAERAAVVHVVGTPARATQEQRLKVHHTFADGEYRRFGQMHAHVTVAQARLEDAKVSPHQIDETLRQCVLESRPVYIEFPDDMVTCTVPAAMLKTPIKGLDDVPDTDYSEIVNKVHELMYSAKKPIVLVDGETRSLRITTEVQRLVSSLGWPTWTTPFGKGIVDEDAPYFHGIYKGYIAAPEEQQVFKEADLVLCFGPHHSSTNSHIFTSIPQDSVAVYFTNNQLRIKGETCRDVLPKFLLDAIIQGLDVSKAKKAENTYPALPHQSHVSLVDLDQSGKLNQQYLWRSLAKYLYPGDIVMGETGTAGHGCREMILPTHSKFFAPVTWLSIGYMLPAAQGASLAQKELLAANKYHSLKEGRTVLFMGDGSFQLTAQEMATMIRKDLNVIIFLINNDGYTIERCIHGLKEEYNDVSRWRYLKAPSFFGAPENTYTASARTWGELYEAMESPEMKNGKGLRMVEIFLEPDDVPQGQLVGIMEAEKKRMGLA